MPDPNQMAPLPGTQDEAPPPMGDNNPPADATAALQEEAAQPESNVLSDFDQSKAEIEGLLARAKVWLDDTGVETDAHAEEVGVLMKDIRAAKTRAENRRKAEVKPLNDAKDAIQGRYNALKAVADTALETASNAVKPFLELQEQRKREEEERARIEAEEKQRALDEAKATADSSNIDDQLAIGEAKQEAKEAKKKATAARNDKASVGGSTDGRSVGLRTVYVGEITDKKKAMQHYYVAQHAKFVALLNTLIAADLRRADRPSEIPGVEIRAEKKAV